MEIIAEVETEPRGVYTGTVALFSPGGDFTGNIGIRTITHREGRCTFGVGSGIVWDATAPAEYEETLAKGAFAVAPPDGEWRPRPGPEAAAGAAGARADLRLFETILLEADGSYRYLDEHLARMAAPPRRWASDSMGRGRASALAFLAGSEAGPLVVRVDLERAGIWSCTTRQAPAACDRARCRCCVSPFRVDPDDPLLAHKTTRRGFYDREHRRASPRAASTPCSSTGWTRVTEGGITNIFARFGGTWVTPPLADGLLPGVWRAAFAAEKAAVERSLTLDELLQADEIVAGNSVERSRAGGRSLLADPLTY